LEYLGRKGWEDRQARFDVLGVTGIDGTPEIDHLMDAFDLTLS
jgi:hypothetical protein